VNKFNGGKHSKSFRRYNDDENFRRGSKDKHLHNI